MEQLPTPKEIHLNAISEGVRLSYGSVSSCTEVFKDQSSFTNVLISLVYLIVLAFPPMAELKEDGISKVNNLPFSSGPLSNTRSCKIQ